MACDVSKTQVIGRRVILALFALSMAGYLYANRLSLHAVGVSVLLTGGACAALVLCSRRKDRFLSQYLFFVRFPLLFGAALVLLPWVGPAIAPESMENIFVMGPLGAYGTSFLSFLLALVIVYTGRLIWVSAPDRMKLDFDEKLHRIRTAVEATPSDSPEARRALRKHLLEQASSVLRCKELANAVTETLKLSGENFDDATLLVSSIEERENGSTGTESEEAKWLRNLLDYDAAPPLYLMDGSISRKAWTGGFDTWFGVALLLGCSPAAKIILEGEAGSAVTLCAVVFGFGTALLLRRVVTTTDALVDRGEHALSFTGCLQPYLSAIVLPKVSPPYQRVHERAVVYFVVTFLLWVVVGIATNPTLRWQGAAECPALIYILFLLMTGTFVLSNISFRFDGYRLPAVGLLFVAVLLLQAFWPSGHEYPVGKWRPEARLSVDTYLRGWIESRVDERAKAPRTLVTVAASGGGITASLWTAKVLTGLDTDVAEFTDSVALLSSVSGGGIGGMLYVNALADGRLSEDERQEIVRNAGATSLAAATWGLVYPDVVRLVLPFAFGQLDRGWAQERRWEQLLGDDSPTLGDWSAAVRTFQRPVQIFNSTLQETGERMLAAPVAIGSASGRRDVYHMLGDSADLQVVTAARLSATFPYVSPQARPQHQTEHASTAFHAADGGYYDNAGLLTLVEILHRYVGTEEGPLPLPDRVALVEIHAGGPPEEYAVPDPAEGGLLTSLFGPFATLTAMRTTSQLARNEFEVELGTALWPHMRPGLQVEHFRFHLSDDQPLSWHLSQAEKDRIVAHWPETIPTPGACEDTPTDLPVEDETVDTARIRARNAATVCRLRNFLHPRPTVTPTGVAVGSPS